MNHLESIISQLQKLKPEIEAFGVTRIGLFGSILRDDFKPAISDVDIIVEFSKPVGIEFVRLGDFLEEHLHQKVDLISKAGIPDAYKKVILQKVRYV